MRGSSESVPSPDDQAARFIREIHDLKFPVFTDPGPDRRRVDLDVFLDLCVQYLPVINGRPGARERRLASKVNVRFVL